MSSSNSKHRAGNEQKHSAATKIATKSMYDVRTHIRNLMPKRVPSFRYPLSTKFEKLKIQCQTHWIKNYLDTLFIIYYSNQTNFPTIGEIPSSSSRKKSVQFWLKSYTVKNAHTHTHTYTQTQTQVYE